MQFGIEDVPLGGDNRSDSVARKGVVDGLAGETYTISQTLCGGVFAAFIGVIEGFVETIEGGKQVAGQGMVRRLESALMFALNSVELTPMFVILTAHRFFSCRLQPPDIGATAAP